MVTFFPPLKLFSKTNNEYPGVPLNDFQSSFALKSFLPPERKLSDEVEIVAAVGNVADCYWNWIWTWMIMVSVSIFTETHTDILFI